MSERAFDLKRFMEGALTGLFVWRHWRQTPSIVRDVWRHV